MIPARQGSESIILAAMLALLLPAAPVEAQDSWVSSQKGSDGNPCTRAAPCLSFEKAHSVMGSFGTINCLDGGEFGSVTITKAIRIACDNVEANILASAGGNGVVIQAGPNADVTLSGLNIDGGGAGIGGIVFISGATLHVDNVKISNFNASPNSGGIYFQPNAYAEFYLADSIITNNGAFGRISGGIVITPGGSGFASASINRVRVENNSTGIIVDGTRSTGFLVNATIRDTVVAGSQGDGVLARSSEGNAAASVLFDRSVATGNFGSGVRAVGEVAGGTGSAIALISDSTIDLNITGVSAAGAGVVQSFKNNRISGNFDGGAPIPPYPGPGGSALQ